ncbi:N-alpha-acetyltransferase MAK3 [Glycine max]|nr:N-alpha-acetyltransferase MAK3 [Glycine max]
MPPMSTIPIHRPEFRTLFFNGSPSPCKCLRITASWTMTMDSKFSPTTKNSNDNNYNLKKKEELSVQIPTPPISKVETLNSNDLQFDRLQPSDQELGRVKRFEFGQFVAREAVLDEEYWTAAWLRAESHWEDRPYDRYVDNYKRKFAEQEFNALKRRCKVQNGDSCACIITGRLIPGYYYYTFYLIVALPTRLKVLMHFATRSFLQERVKAPLFCSINRTPPSRYGYIANLCVIKSVRRQGIASNMMSFAIEAAKSNGLTQVYVHVDRNNRPAQILYQKMGFEVILLLHVYFPLSVMD